MTDQTARIDKIVDDGLCLGCGLCASLSGSMIEMQRGDDGDLRPVATADLSQKLVDDIYQTCPSLRIEGLPPHLQKEAAHHDLVWGAYEGMFLGHAGNAAIRHEGSTAGMLTALGIYLLESGKVEAIMHVKAADSPANFGTATLSYTKEEVRQAAGSRYGPTAALADIGDVLSRHQNIAVIAKPCDLNALRNLAHIDARVNETISYWLTMICGGFQPDAAFHEFLTTQEVGKTGLSSVRYRGYGCPGPTSLHFEDGRQVDFHYLDFWGEDESQWSMPLRCKICADGIGEAADIAAGDAWDGASPDRVESETDPGFNSVIARTKKGQALIDEAVAAGAITLTETVDPSFMSRTQPHQHQKKLAGLARMEGLRKAGSVAPEIVNMRRDALSETLGQDGHDKERAGAFKRALAARKS